MFLFWGKRVDGFSIFLGRLKRFIDAVVTVFLFLAFLGGTALLVLRVQATPVSEVLTAAFWQDPHSSLLAFWFGVICMCFWRYRRSVEAERTQPVKPRAYGERLKDVTLPEPPALWRAVRKMRRRDRLDVSMSFTSAALKALDDSWSLARKLKHASVEPVHLFAGLLQSTSIAVVFGRLGIRFDQVKENYYRLLAKLPQDDLATAFSGKVRDVLLQSYVEAYELKLPMVDVTEMFVAAIRADEGLQELLFDAGVTAQKAENVVAWIRVQELMRQRFKKFSAAAKFKPKSTMNRAMTALATPYLDRMSHDLTRSAASGYIDPVIGREREFESLFRVIEGGGKSVILVGQPGVGKEAIIEGVAQRMVEEDVPAILQDKRLLNLNIAQLVSGATAAEAQERLLTALYEVARAGNIVLVVPNVAGMVGITSGSGESIDLSQVFATELSRGYFFAIATATPREYSDALEGTPLGRALTKVEVPEMDENEAIRVLEAKAGMIEYQNGVFFSYDAVEAAVTMADRYLHEQFLPEKAIEIAKESALSVRNKKGKDAIITKEDVAGVVAEKTGIPLKQLTVEESQKLLDLESQMHQRMIGQDMAVKSVAAAMRRGRAELREQTRPIANFLFLGPTGVGKTELAKTLAEVYFGREDAMIRLDMSEYQDKAALYKLIGEPAGEQSGGILSEAIRKQPFSLLLLDELEKAHPDILTVFLQVMDDGRLTDNVGRTIDFTNVILIATSNAGAPFIQEELRKGTAMEIIKDRLLAEQLKAHYRPEFLNRFDDIIVFTPLSEAEIVKIAGLMLKKVAKRLEEKGFLFEATDEAVAELAHAGFDPLFGARPLRRVIQDRVDNAIADIMLKGQLRRRDKIILEKGGTLRVEKARKL
jgi:ATP-dependent Clp protease ATP-binding subunit ClpC